MTVGEGIFLGLISLALVWLYATTKDRWNWKRIASWSAGVPVGLLLLAGVAIWAVRTYNDRASPQSVFGGIVLASTEDDVRFAKGHPSKVLEPGLWVYYSGSGSVNSESAGYVVRFKDGKVRYISYLASRDQVVNPDLLGFTLGSPYAQVLDKLGQPDHVATSDDGLQRIVSYSKLNTFYTFQRSEVSGLGIYDPSTGPLLFKNAAITAAPPASNPVNRLQEAPEVQPVLDHCAPGLVRDERLKRLGQHGAVRETSARTFEAGGRTVSFGFDGGLIYCH